MKKILAIVCLFSCLLDSAQAWNAYGHMVVSQIAYNHLAPDVKAKCDALIAVSVLGSGNNNSNFVTAACWADDIKGTTSAYNTWHYIDIPFSLDGTTTNGFVPDSFDVVQAINQCVAVLQDQSATTTTQATCLRFILHFVGDIQQPLHCSTAISAAHTGGDAGGNSFSLTGTFGNLHSLWDSGGGYVSSSLSRPLSSGSQTTLSSKVADVEAAYPYSIGFITLPNPMAWATEGVNHAQTNSYVGVTNGTTPTSAYTNTVQLTTKQLLANGGQRLADLLNLLMHTPTNIVVTNVADSGPGTLRQAVTDAISGDSITFAANLSGQTITLTNGQIAINKNLTIDGSTLAGGIRIDGHGTSRIFSAASGTTNVLNSLTLANGYASTGFGSVGYGVGGAIAAGGSLNLTRCTLVGNTTTGTAGGIFCDAGSAMMMAQCTLTGNSAANAGGIGSYSALTVLQSTITGNSAGNGGGIYNLGTLALTNSIVAGNTPNNFAGNPIIGTGNLTNGSPLLASLGNYGGATPTMPPLPGSPAIDAAATSSFNTDQRGFPRPVGSAVDIGAVEGVFNPTGSFLKNLTRLGNGSFQFTFTNYSDISFRVMATTNMSYPISAWSNLGPAIETSPGSGQFYFNDPQASNLYQRYYRVKTP